MANYTSSFTGAQIDSAVDRANSTDVTAGTVTASKAVIVDSNKDITGFRNITATGTVTALNVSLTGDTTIGDGNTDNITINADINSNMIPNTDNTFDLGSSSQQWKDLYLNGVAYLDSVDLEGDLLLKSQSDIRFYDSDSSNYIAIQSAATVGSNYTLTLPDADGSNKQFMRTDGSGALTFAFADRLNQPARNVSGSTISAGTPVYVTGYNSGENRVTIAPSDASDSATMPAIGVTTADISNNANGEISITGIVESIDTSSFSVGDTLYVANGGGLTATKPTGTYLIQNIAHVLRAHASAGEIQVISTYRTNDLPNIAEDAVWIGNSSGVPTATDFDTVLSTRLATTSVKGIASFSSDNFDVSSGVVTIKDNGVTLATETTGDFVNSITGGTGIDSTGATSGENISHTLSLNLNELTTETTIADADFIAMVDATDNGSGKITFENLEDAIFSSVSGDIAIAEDGTATIQANSVALGTDTTGNFMSDVSVGTGLDVTHTPGEGSTATIDIDLNELGTETTIADADFLVMVDATDSGSQKITFENLEDAIFASVSGDINIAEDGTATIQANSVALATDTTGDFVASITAGTGLTSTGATSGENIAHSLSVDASQTQITAVGALGTGSISSGFGNIDIGSSDLTATGTVSLGASSFNDNNITNVGDIALDSISADGSTINVAIGDNTSDVFTIKQSTNKYFAIDTSDTAENIAIGTGVSGTAISIGHSTSTTTVNDDLIVTGDLTVNGATTTLNTTNSVISDTLIELGNGTTGTPANDSGIVIERGDSNNAFLGFDESDDKFIVGTGTFTGASTGSLTITTGTLKANIEGSLDVSSSTLTTTAAQNLVIMQGANSNVDIGSFKMTASTFESDVATGTAPIIVASTTKVANLNADLLDDQTGSYYLDFSNFVVDDNEISGDKINGGTIESITINALAGQLNLGGNDITAIGSLSLDTLQSGATDAGFTVSLLDNVDPAIEFMQGTTLYMKITTSDGGESIEFHKPIDFGVNVGTMNFNSNNMTNVDIDSGTIDGTTIGASSASTGAFTTLTASSSFTLDNASGSGVIRSQSSADNTIDLTASSGGDAFIEASDTSQIKIGHASSTKLIIDTHANSGRVGIGTTSPNTTLTLSDGTDEFDFGVTTNQLMIKSVTSDGSDDQRIIIDAGNGGTSSTRGAYIALSGNEASSEAGNAIYQVGNISGASHIFRISGGVDGVTIDNSGKVGIGTTSPSYTLHTTKAVAGDWLALFSNTSSSSGNGMLIDADSEILRLRDDVGNTKYQFFTDKTLLNAGNVGINVTSPEDKLHIAGGTAAVSDTQLVLEGRYGGYGAGINFVSRTSSGGTNVSMAKITADGEAAFDTTASNQDAGLRFFTTLNGSSAEKIRITSEGRVIQKNTALANSCFDIVNGSSSGYGLYIKAGNSGNYALSVNDYNANNLMVVNGNGNVGIGTNNPSDNLHIQDSVPGLRIVDTGNNATAQIGYSDGSGFFLRLPDDANNEDVMIRSYGDTVFNGGSVGIGTTSPNFASFAKALTIHDLSNNVGLEINRGATASAPTFYISTESENDIILANRKSGYIRFLTDNSERMRIESTGNIIFQDGCPIHADTGRNAGKTVSTSYTTIIDFSTLGGVEAAKGFYLVTMVRDGSSVGTSLVLLVGVSTSSAVYIYDTLISNGLVAQTSGADLQVKRTSGTSTIHATAIPIGIVGTD